MTLGRTPVVEMGEAKGKAAFLKKQLLDNMPADKTADTGDQEFFHCESLYMRILSSKPDITYIHNYYDQE